MKRKLLTTTQLAQKICTPRKWVCNAEYNHRLGMSYLSNSQVGQVNMLMTMHGITWDDVRVRRQKDAKRRPVAAGEEGNE